MMHCWVSYKNECDQVGEESFYCDRCGIKIYTIGYYVSGVRAYNANPINDNTDGADFETMNCEEYIIKAIIE
jgi:hypothetical protein